MMKIYKSMILASIILTTQIVAQENSLGYDGTSVGVEAGIFGLGINLNGKLSDSFGVKVGFDSYTYKDITVEDDQTKYIFDVNTQDFLGTLDWHPYQGSFMLRGGLIINYSNLDGDITPNIEGVDNGKIEFDFNGQHYSYATDELGSIHTIVDFDPVAPYVGIGWDTSWTKKSGLGFTFDMGLIYQGSARTSYELKYGAALDVDKRIAEETANLPAGAAKDALIASITQDVNSKKLEIEKQIKDSLDEEMLSLQTELDKYQFLPYIAIGVNYKF